MFGNATRMVQTEPGPIVGPISTVLGFILDFIFNIFYFISPAIAFGFGLIFFTIIIRTLILPLAIKTHKSMQAMKKIQPDLQKLNEKYGSTKDPEKMRQKQMEMQALYTKNKANPLGGCLPMLIQMPILITLFNMFQRPYLYMSHLGDTYRQIANHVMSIPNFYYYIENNRALWEHRLPDNIDLHIRFDPNELVRLLNVFDNYDWQELFRTFPALDVEYVTGLINHADVIEHFMGISMVMPSSLTNFSIVIPVLAAATTYFSSRIMMKNQQSAATSETMQQQQKILKYVTLYGIPVMMVFMAFTMPVAVSLYWIVGNLYQLTQHTVLNKVIK